MVEVKGFYGSRWVLAWSDEVFETLERGFVGEFVCSVRYGGPYLVQKCPMEGPSTEGEIYQNIIHAYVYVHHVKAHIYVGTSSALKLFPRAFHDS